MPPQFLTENQRLLHVDVVRGHGFRFQSAHTDPRPEAVGKLQKIESLWRPSAKPLLQRYDGVSSLVTWLRSQHPTADARSSLSSLDQAAKLFLLIKRDAGEFAGVLEIL